MSNKVQKGSKAAFELFANKDKEAGGTGKGGCADVIAAAASDDPNSPNAIKANLLRWCQVKTAGYPNVNIEDFSKSWCDGMAFAALIHQYVPHTFDFNRLNPKNRKGNLQLAFKVAEMEADIAPLIEVEDMLLMGNKPDWKCIFTYVQTFYRKMEIEKARRSAAPAPASN